MFKALSIIAVSLIVGFYVSFYALLTAGSLFVSKLVPEASMSFTSDIEQPSEGQTKVLPEIQLQPASSIQGTVGVE